MTLIDIRRTADVLLAFEESKRKSNRLYEGAYQTSKQLNNFSGMQQVRRALENILDDMEEERQVFGQMTRCLEESCRVYGSYENEITEFTEEVQNVNSKEQVIEVFRVPENLFRLLR